VERVKATAVTGQFAEAVPLVFEVSTPVFSPLGTAAVQILVALSSAYAGVWLLNFITTKYTEETWSSELAPDSRIKRSKTVAGAILRAINSPLSVILPTAAVFHSVRVLTCRMNQSMQLCTTCARNTFERRAQFLLDLILKILTPVDDFISAVLKTVFLLTGVWLLVTFKNQYVTWVLEQKAKRSPALLQNFKRMIIPLNDLVSWMIVALGAVTAAGLAGLDVRPLLTFGGVSGIIVGLSAQSVLSNMIAGINLFLSRPFVDGDRVQVFSNNGSMIYNGVVERVNPLRTIIRTDRNTPLAVPNKLLSEWVIGNESRFPTTATFPIETLRRIQIALKFGSEHFEQLDDVTASITKVLEEFPGLNHGIPFGVNIGTLSDSEVMLEIQATALKREASHFGELRVALLRALKEALQAQGIEGYKLTF